MNDSFCSTVTTYTKGCSEIQRLISTADETTFSSSTHTHFNSTLRNLFHVEDVFTYFLRILRSNEFCRFCHKPDCFSTHAVIASTSTFHLPPQTRCSPCISNPLCVLHKICLLLSIRNEIRRESLFLQAKILLTSNHHEGVLRDVKVKLRTHNGRVCRLLHALVTYTWKTPCIQLTPDLKGHQSQSLNDGDKEKTPTSLRMTSGRQVSGP
jgi:hypothetical protein